jgi:hypothetical protein
MFHSYLVLGDIEPGAHDLGSLTGDYHFDISSREDAPTRSAVKQTLGLHPRRNNLQLSALNNQPVIYQPNNLQLALALHRL